MIQKVTKKSSLLKGFFAALASARQIRQNLGWDKFALLSLHTSPYPSAKNPYALLPLSPALFCLISPEAIQPTDSRKLK